MKNKIVALLTVIAVFTGLKATAQQVDSKYNIIPYPTSLIGGQGSFVVTPATTIVYADGGLFINEANRLNEFFANSFGKPLKLSVVSKGHAIQLKYDAGINADEGYRLVINAHQITIAARTPAGMFMAVQTIRQLLPVNVEYPNNKTVESLTLPTVTINSST